MKVLEPLAYTCDEPTVLLNLFGKVKELQEEIRSVLPRSDGLLLRPVSHLKTAKKIKLKYKWLVESAASYSSLEAPRKRGRKRQNWKVQRVGIKATKLKEVALHAPRTPPSMAPTTLKRFSGNPSVTELHLTINGYLINTQQTLVN